MNPIRIAVIGVGAFGQNHARVLESLEEAELVAVVDQDAARAEKIADEHGCRAVTDAAELKGAIEAAVVAVPTVQHEATRRRVLDPSRPW